MLRGFTSTLFGETYGDGVVQVLWLHGWGRRGNDFAAAAGVLAQRGVASVALDLPGFGASAAPETAGGARHYAELIEPVFESLGDTPLVLVGHSFGGTVATVVASSHPERIRALVLTGVPLLRLKGASRAPRAYRAVRWLHGRGLVGDARLEAVRQRYGSRDYRAATGVMRDVLVARVNESYETELRSVEAPVTMLWGEEDRDVPVEVARRAAALLPHGASLRVLAGVDHFVPTRAPDALADAVSGALAP